MKDIIKRNFNFRHLSLFTVMFLFVMNLSAAENFYDNYSESERLVIAGAYLAVSQQYEELGEDKKATDYKEMAEQILPGIDAVDISSEQPGTEEVEKVQTAAPARPSGKESSAVRYYFSKLIRAVFSENKADINSLLSTRLYLPGYDEGVKKSEVMDYVAYAFDKYELDRTDPSLIYKTGRLYLKSEGSSWVASMDLTENGEKIFKEEIGFSGNRHMFYFREYREGWRLIAINAETVEKFEDF
jgi:hypothetical protein